MPKRKILLRWIKVILMLYGLIGIAIYYLQDKVLFRPEKMDSRQAYGFSVPHKEINIPFNDQANISIVEFTTAAAPKGVVLYFHGNRKNIGRFAKFAPNFTKNGYEVWMIDYPGYGKSTGPLTEQRLYDFADQLYKLAAARFARDSIVIYGKSLGSGIAAWLASKKNCRQLILETPYYSITSLCQRYFPIYPVTRMIHYKIPLYQYLQQVIVPVTILHGSSDGVIPYSNAEKLKPFLKPTDKFITIEGGSHNDLNDFPLFHQTLDTLLK
jgi:alpha-beta hydrolase superfamily lysophospholipase